MFEVLWKVKIGYGDILSPLCYSHNECVRRNEPVNLIYLFEQNERHKYKKQDSETLSERIDFLNRNTDKSDLMHPLYVEKDYNIRMPDSFDHKNYKDENTSLHNLRFSDTYRWTGEGDHIAMITSIRNKHPFSGASKWKDPHQGEWCDIIHNTRNVKLVHYETPIEQSCEIISTARFAITYHGSAAWLCKWIGVPMIVVSRKPDWSRTVFPWACTTQSLHILDCLEKSATGAYEERMIKIKKDMWEYLYVRD